MPTDSRPAWPSFALADVFYVRSGLSKPASEFGSGFPFVTFKDVFDNYFLPETLGSLVRSSEMERELCDVRRGDVFLTRTSETQEELGMSSVALRDYNGATFNGFTKRLRPKNPQQIVPEYVAYYLRGPRFRSEISAFSSLSTRASLNNDMLGRLRIVLPEPKIQEEIGYTLRSLDDKIEQNRRTARALEEFARATFKAWFVDFEPVMAKAAGAACFPGMPGAAFAALPDHLAESPLGPVPQGWDTPAFSEIVKQSSERVGTASVPAYSSTNEGLRPRDEQFKKDLAKSFAKNLLIRSGDLVFGNSREILNFGVMYEPAGSVSQVYKVFRLRSEVVTPRYIEMMIRECSAFYRQIIRSTTRDNQGIMADFFLQLPLLVPPQEFRDAYAAVEKPVREMIDHLQVESAKLAALRDYLLPRLLSGQVRVRSSQAEV